ncbi:MAG TPA: hypothetical protein VLI40_02630 [Gemmatimonadaceae bacterium]|nr:hypothetical protein [Gemmatimonadaceae bacterium]
MMIAPEFAPTVLAPLRDGSHDFDFLHGRWRVHHWRLCHPLSGSSEWYEFDGTAVERPLWDGHANFEELDARLSDGRLCGRALRLYSPSSRQWAIHRSTAHNGTLDHPMMIGDFRNGYGEFYSQERFEECSIRVRFYWTCITREKCRWEQAYSADGGTTWETNWIMSFTRMTTRR